VARPSVGIRLLGLGDVYKAIDRYGVRPFENAWARASMAGARIATRAIRAAAPKGKTGNLRRSVRARRPRTRGVEAALAGQSLGIAIAGPTAPHRHLVIRGHRIVTTSGIVTGQRARGNPFVDRAVAGVEPLIVEAVKREFFKR